MYNAKTIWPLQRCYLAGPGFEFQTSRTSSGVATGEWVETPLHY